MRFVAGFVLFLAAVAAVVVYGQEEFGLLGRYDDVRRVPDNFTKESNQFVFTRLIYNGRIPGYYKNWYTDYPKSDRTLLKAVTRLTNLNVDEHERAIAITDPNLFKYPFLYTSEPEQMVLSDNDAKIMREYLDRGGFWMLDDNWGTFEWALMEKQIRKILPNAEIKDIPKDHAIFHQ